MGLPALPCAVRAAREDGIVGTLTEAGIQCWADKGYRGAGSTVRIPCWGRWGTQKAAERRPACTPSSCGEPAGATPVVRLR